MKEIAISEFKAKCLGILEEVGKTRKPIRVTRFGKPVAEVVPPSPRKPVGKRLGSHPLMELLLDTHIWLLERARANEPVKAHRTGYRQPGEPAVAFAHQHLEAVNAHPKGKRAIE